MVKSWKYCLSSILLLSLFSCNKINKFYESHSSEGDVYLASQKYESLKDSNFYDTGTYYDNMIRYTSILQEVKELNPEHSWAWFGLSKRYLEFGMFEKWKEHFDKALFLDPVRFQGERGHILLYYFKDYEKALADFNGVEVINPNGPDYIKQTNVNYLIAICHMQLGDYDNALKYFEKYRKEETASLGEDYLYDTYYLYMGITYIRMKLYQKAIEILNKGQSKNDGLADYQYHLARAHYFLGDYSPILKLLDDAEQLIYKGKKNKTYDGEEIEEIYLEDILEFRDYIERLNKKTPS